MKKILGLLAILGMFSACNQYDDAPVIIDAELPNLDIFSEPLPELSIYNLPSTWTTHNNEELELEALRGKVLVMVMVYTECKAACPRLVADMRNLEKQVPAEDLDKVKFIMVSIDPETDTPERLQQFSIDNAMEDDHWLLLRGTLEDTREFATVLAVSYKKISPIDFSHSNIISVFDENGVLVHQREGLGVDNKQTIAAINEEINN